ncbi:DNA topoisomerase 2 [Massospora cicadina]|nr:DNA topoisomerase 2 [Massospora cicadina]
MNVATLASFNPSAKITRHSISLFTQLPEARKEAEVLLTAFVETLSHHYLDAEVENSYYADLSPHYADAPTPWLSALIRYCNQHPLIEAGLSENQPPTPPHPLPWWKMSGIDASFNSDSASDCTPQPKKQKAVTKAIPKAACSRDHVKSRKASFNKNKAITTNEVEQAESDENPEDPLAPEVGAPTLAPIFKANPHNGIPVEFHKEEKVYIPELIFGHLLTSSNYDNSEKKVVGGRNGYGAELCNIFSTDKLKLSNFKDYIHMYLKSTSGPNGEDLTKRLVFEQVSERWEVNFVPSSSGQLKQVSFINSISTSKGGTHVNYMVDMIVKLIQKALDRRKLKSKILPGAIKGNMWIFINCLIDNPSFDSQTKESMTLKPASFGSHCKLAEKFQARVLKSWIITMLTTLSQAKDKMAMMKALDSTKIKGNQEIKDLCKALGLGSKKVHLDTSELRNFEPIQDDERQLIDLAFNNKNANDCKEWLTHFCPGNYICQSKNSIKYMEFFNKELMQFFVANNIQSIPSVVDGLKPSQRKVVYSCLLQPDDDVKLNTLTGDVKPSGSNCYKVCGRITKIGDQLFSITELPIGVWTQTYDTMMENWYLNTDMIEKYEKHHSDLGVKYIVQVPEFIAKLEEEELYAKFKLTTTISTFNLVCFDKYGCIKHYASAEEILTEFYNIRLQFYQKRKEYLVSKLKQERIKLSNQARFTVAIIKDKLEIRNVTYVDLIQQLIKLKFTPIIDKDNNGATYSGFRYLLEMENTSINYEMETVEKNKIDFAQSLTEGTSCFNKKRIKVASKSKLKKKSKKTKTKGLAHSDSTSKPAAAKLKLLSHLKFKLIQDDSDDSDDQFKGSLSQRTGKKLPSAIKPTPKSVVKALALDKTKTKLKTAFKRKNTKVSDSEEDCEVESMLSTIAEVRPCRQAVLKADYVNTTVFSSEEKEPIHLDCHLHLHLS